jgi:hypothetical protein
MSVSYGAENMEYIWANSVDDSPLMSRKLTNMERMYYIFHEKLYGQNCPSIGARISLQRQHNATGVQSLSFSEL